MVGQDIRAKSLFSAQGPLQAIKKVSDLIFRQELLHVSPIQGLPVNGFIIGHCGLQYKPLIIDNVSLLIPVGVPG